MPARSILLINRVLPPAPGATGRLLAELAQDLADAGWRVTILVDQGPSPAADPGQGPRLHVCGSGGPAPDGVGSYAAAALRLARAALRLPGHDLVVTMTDPPLLALLGPLLRWSKGSRLLHWSHDLYPDLLPLLGRRFPRPVLALAGAAMRFALRRHDRIICIGPCMMRRLSAQGIDRRRLSLVPNWPQEALLSAETDRAWVEELLGMRLPALVALYAGTLGLAHPGEILLDAAQRLSADATDLLLLVVGGGRRAADLAGRAKALGLANLRILPVLSDTAIARLSVSVDLHLALMQDDAAGLMLPCKVPAALGAGKPLLFCGPEGSGAAALLRESGAGLVLPPSGVALAGALRRLAADPDALAGLTARARLMRQRWTRHRATREIGSAAAALLPNHPERCAQPVPGALGPV